MCNEGLSFSSKNLACSCIGIRDNRREVLTSRQGKAAARIGVPTLGNSQRNGARKRQNQRKRMKFNVAEIFSYNEPCLHRNLLSLGLQRSFVLNEFYVSPRLLSKASHGSLPQPGFYQRSHCIVGERHDNKTQHHCVGFWSCGWCSQEVTGISNIQAEEQTSQMLHQK